MTDSQALPSRVTDLADAWSDGTWPDGTWPDGTWPDGGSPRGPSRNGALGSHGHDGALNLLRRAEFRGIDYSDGPEAERRIYEAVCTARDRSTFSPELARAITDWPSEYHLSRERHCIVRPLGIKPGERVLELGCGCGAITRYLGEIGAQVTAVEGAGLRARTAAERCRDLRNVTVVVDDAASFATEQRFDWVLLIGVLEYAPVYSDAPDAVGAVARLLRAAAALLAPGGRLVVAIENKLGLKYFNGCGEDHAGIPFHGVQGLYGERSARTFGRGELTALVHAAGLPHVAFRYPFPDYKLPRIVLAEAALTDPGFDAAGTLAKVQARDYTGRPDRRFDEALVARELARNGLLGDLSNSFLLVAAHEPCAGDGVVATAFSAQRKAEFAVETRFARVGDTIRVQKRRLYPQRARTCRLPGGGMLENIVGEAAYAPGPLALEALTVARSRHGDLAAIVAALAPWFDFLLGQAGSSAGRRLADLVLPGHYIDVTPFNLVATEQGLRPIDMEWRVDCDVPLGWVVTRSVLHSLVGVAGFEAGPVTVAEVVGALAARHSLGVRAGEIEGWLGRERDLQRAVTGREPPDYTGGLASHALAPPPVTARRTHIGALAPAFARLKERVARTVARLRPASETARYGWAAIAVAMCFALTSLLTLSGVRTPRMLLYIAAVAVAARLDGLGPGVFALGLSVLAILATGPFLHLSTHGFASMERLGIFLICAVIGILVSIPREKRDGAYHP